MVLMKLHIETEWHWSLESPWLEKRYFSGSSFSLLSAYYLSLEVKVQEGFHQVQTSTSTVVVVGVL